MNDVTVTVSVCGDDRHRYCATCASKWPTCPWKCGSNPVRNIVNATNVVHAVHEIGRPTSRHRAKRMWIIAGICVSAPVLVPVVLAAGAIVGAVVTLCVVAKHVVTPKLVRHR